MAVVVGTMIGMLCIVFMQMGIHHFYPPPPGTDLYYADSVEKAMKAMPLIVFRLLLVSYAIAAFIAGITATIISKRVTRNPALVSGSIMTIAGIINVLTVHLPLWFSIAGTLAYVPFAYLGYRLARKKVPSTT